MAMVLIYNTSTLVEADRSGVLDQPEDGVSPCFGKQTTSSNRRHRNKYALENAELRQN